MLCVSIYLLIHHPVNCVVLSSIHLLAYIRIWDTGFEFIYKFIFESNIAVLLVGLIRFHTAHCQINQVF